MKEKVTEELIKTTAKKIFFAQGKVNAKMHEIASEAKINRALLHYYFRNRENLFEIVLKEAIDESFIKMFEILSEELAFEKKIEKAIHHIIDCLSEYPFIETFIISEINKDPDHALNLEVIKGGKAFTKKFLKEIEQYIAKHKLPFISAEDFIINMMALCSYPSATKPIISNILGYSDTQYKNFIEQRKKILPQLVLMKR